MSITILDLQKEVLPYISICISLVSLCIAFYVMFRDRIKFEVVGSYKPSLGNMVDGLYVKIVNTGRRPITLYELTFTCKDGKLHRTKITNSTGKRAGSLFSDRDYSNPCLAESQFFEFMLDNLNYDFESFELESVSKVQIVSSTGLSKTIKGLARDIKKNARHFKKST